MPSLKRREGYLLIDNSNGPGVGVDQLKRTHKGTELVAVPEGRKFECATLTCSHCQRVVLLNPERKRERAYCRKCDHYLCDACGAEAFRTGVCLPYNALLDEAREREFLREQAGLPPSSGLILK